MELGGFQMLNVDFNLMYGWNDLIDELKEEYKEKGVNICQFCY